MVIGKESEILEFKLSTGERKEACESIAAILNKHCKGTLYFGVFDNGLIRGQQVSDSTIKDISRTISELIEPRIMFSIETIAIEGKDIIKVSFSGQNRPYSVSGKFLSRSGTENRRMSNDELRKIIKYNDYSSKWEEEITNYKISDLDDEALADFYNSAKNCGRLETPNYDKEKLLANLDLIQDGFVKNGCYALFGKNARIGLKLATYATDNKVTFTDLKLINGNIYNLINVAISYILEHINWRSEIGKRKREDIPEIPEMAIREIVVNAFAHSDYEVLSEIEIGIHPSKIEIYNPGTFPEELTPLDFISNNLPSYRRNKLILDILFRSKDVEKTGTGFQRVNELCSKNNISWAFKKEAYGFFFEFVRENVQTNVHMNVQTNVYTNVQINKILSDSEQKILNLIVNNEKITKKELSFRMNKSERTIQRIINSLIKKNIIIRIGPNRSCYWQIVNNHD